LSKAKEEGMKICFVMCAALAMALWAQPQVVNSFDAPDTGISGLTFTDGSLFALSSVSQTVFRLDPTTGAVQDSFTVSPAGPNGLGDAGSLLYVTNGTSNVYKYTLDGTAQGSTSLYCSG
jgi:outer membrane protein assembly factor BamB